MTTPGSVPPSRPSLATLCERIRSLDARPQDIDALLRGLRWSPPPGADLRTHSKLLHLLIETPALGDLRGSSGQRVDQAAVYALLALGQPYASELSGKGRRILEQTPAQLRPPVRVRQAGAPGRGSVASSPKAGPSTPMSRLVGGLLVGWNFVELFIIASRVVSSGLLGIGLVMFVALVNYFSLVGAGIFIYTRATSASTRSGYIFVNLLMIPMLLMLAFVSAIFGGSNEMNAAIASFMVAMGVGAGVRLFAVICLSAMRQRKPA